MNTNDAVMACRCSFGPGSVAAAPTAAPTAASVAAPAAASVAARGRRCCCSHCKHRAQLMYTDASRCTANVIAVTLAAAATATMLDAAPSVHLMLLVAAAAELLLAAKLHAAVTRASHMAFHESYCQHRRIIRKFEY